MLPWIVWAVLLVFAILFLVGGAGITGSFLAWAVIVGFGLLLLFALFD